MRRPALLLVLAAALLLGGCTLTFGAAGAVMDGTAKRRPVEIYTLDEPPPRGTPVTVVTRDGRDTFGQWSRVKDGPESPSVVIVRPDGRTSTVRGGDIVEIRSRSRTSAVVPMMLTGFFVDGILAYYMLEIIVTRAFDHSD